MIQLTSSYLQIFSLTVRSKGSLDNERGMQKWIGVQKVSLSQLRPGRLTS
jgi:hypothetical protein